MIPQIKYDIINHNTENVSSDDPTLIHPSLYFVQHDKSMFWQIMQIVFYLEVFKSFTI